MSKGGGGQQYALPTYSAQNSNTSTVIPSWLTAASQQGVDAASKLLSNPGQAYGGELAPGMTADQQAAGDMFRNSVGAYNPFFSQAQGYTDAATQQGPQIDPQTFKNGLAGISDYMNPYISNVVDSVSKLGQQNLQQSLNQTGDQAIGAHAFGGSRHGVQEGVATAQNNLQTNNLIANLLNSGYGQATNMLGQDISNNMQAQGANQNAFSNYMNRLMGAGQQTAGIGTAARSANVGDINNVFQYGNAAQQTQGAQDSARYQEFLRQQQMPYQALQAYNQTLGTAPHDTNQNTATSGWQMSPQQQQQSSPLMTGLGLGMAGLSMLPGGTIPGLLGGALSALGGPSPFPRGNYF